MKQVALEDLPSEPLVSVLIGNFNYSEYLEDMCSSLESQTYAHFEAIICDDGSTDGSIERLRDWTGRDDRFNLIAKENAGHASALNRAYRHSRGDIFCLLDPDDYFAPTKLERVVRRFRESQLGFVHHPMIRVDVRGRHLQPFPRFARLDEGWLADVALKRGGRWRSSITSAIAFRREVAEKLFPIPEESFRRAPDGFITTLIPFLTMVGAVDQPLTYYRLHSRNTTSTETITQADVVTNIAVVRTMIQEANTRLSDLGYRVQLDPGRNGYLAEQQLLLNIYTDPSRTRLASQLVRLLKKMRTDRFHTRRERFLLALMYGLAIGFPARHREQWISRSRSLLRTPRLLRRSKKVSERSKNPVG